jgi:hypothetical protein
VYNFGTDIEMSMRDVAQDLVSRFGYTGAAAEAMIQFYPDRPFNDSRCDKIVVVFGGIFLS